MSTVLNWLYSVMFGTAVLFISFMIMQDETRNMNAKTVGIPINVSGEYYLETFTATGTTTKGENGLDSILKKMKKDNKILVLDLNPLYQGKQLKELDLATMETIFKGNVYAYYGTDGKPYQTRYYPK